MYFFKVSRKIIVVLDQIFLRYNIKITLKKWLRVSTSLVAQWIRVCLPMQETGSIPNPHTATPEAHAPRACAAQEKTTPTRSPCTTN